MGSLCKSPTPPPAPDPTVVANAQSQANIASAQEQQKLNMVNTYGPNGSVVYGADPNAPGGYSQTTTLSPQQQAIQNGGAQAQIGALGIANDQLGRVSSALGHGLDPSGVQTSYNQGGPIQTSYDPGGDIRSRFNQGQSVQGEIGPQDLLGAYQAAANASYGQAQSRLDPQWDLRQNQLDTQLKNQGLAQDSDAYKNAMSSFGRDRNDAYNQANFSSQGQGLNAENTLFGQSATQGQFHNQAAGQDYTQNLGAAQFANQAQLQYNQEHAQQAQFANQAQSQQNLQNANQAQFANQANNQQFQQNAYSQELPINEFNSLMSSNQVGMPQGIQYTPSQVGQTDVLGSYALNSQVANAGYQAKVQQQNALLGGLSQLGGAAIMASDVRLKRDVELIGREADGLGVYRYAYLWDEPDEPRRVGVMAQEAQVLRPHAVLTMPNGYLAVNYETL